MFGPRADHKGIQIMAVMQIDKSVSVPDNPLDILETMCSANDWPFERCEDEQFVVNTTGGWCDYRLFFLWRADLHSLYFSCSFDMKVPEKFRRPCGDLLLMMNEQLWLGHFHICSEAGTPIFRHTLPARGVASFSVEQLEDLMDTALGECERFYPAFQYVIWGGHSPEQAMASALLDCQGEA